MSPVARPSPTVDPGADGYRAALVVLAGGSGTRVGADLNKVYLPLADRHVISWSFWWAREVKQVTRFVLVVRPEDAPLAREILARDLPDLPVELVDGGRTRHGSEQAALHHLDAAIADGDLDVIAIHDGARPLVGPELLRSVLGTAVRCGGAVPGVMARDLLSVEADGTPTPLAATIEPPLATKQQALVRVQTPQAFRAAPLRAVYAAAARAGFEGTDTASSVQEFSDLAVQIVPGGHHNLKITFPEDLAVAERLLRERLRPDLS